MKSPSRNLLSRSASSASPVAPAPSDPFALAPHWTNLLLFAAALVAFFPALSGGFLWDDSGHVTRADIQGFTGLIRIWTEIGATQQYYPLLHSAFWLEHKIWGDSAAAYHLLNVLLHATSACLFAAVLRRLAVPGAALAALLFALHPVCVESVAWISEQKNTLSTVLYLAAAIHYLRFDADRRPAHYYWATALFIAALFTKSVTATLPAALLVVFWWQRGRLSLRTDVLPLLPWFALGIIGGLLTASVEHSLIGATGDEFALSAVQRLLLSGRVVWFYLGKLLWPADLIFIYPRWTIDPASFAQWLFPVAALALLGALAFWSRRNRAPLAAALFFGGTLFPALGFFNVYPFIFSYVADHFQYLASLGVFAFLAAAVTRLTARISATVPRSGAAALLVLLAVLTRAQCGPYRDVVTLYQVTLAANPNCWMAENNLGTLIADEGRYPDAIAHFERSLALRPNNAEALNNLANSLNQSGRPAEALAHLDRALQLVPRFAEAHNNYGIALMTLTRFDEGIAHFKQALQINPKFALAKYNLGLAYANSNRPLDAIASFQAALQLQPDYPEAELNWGIGLAVTNRIPEALPHFERALALKPDYVEAHIAYGRALGYTGRTTDALAHFEEAIEINPASAEAHINYALALRQLGRTQEATQHFAEAQRLNPRLSAPPR